LQIWAVVNQKGGVGKTTSAVALGGLAAAEGKRVLLIDLDPHGSMTSYFGLNPDRLELSVFTLFQQRKTLTEAIVENLVHTTSQLGLSLLPSSTALATLERQVIGQDGMGLVLTETLKLLQPDYDLVIIDSPPLLGVLMINALAACTELIIPVQTEHLALKGLERMIHTLQMMARSRKHPPHYTIVGTMFDRRTQASVSSLRIIRNAYHEQTWPGKIPVDTKFRDASKAGVAPHVYDPETHGVSAYKSLLKWLQQRQNGDSSSKILQSNSANAVNGTLEPKSERALKSKPESNYGA